jgi:hypothetical protein
LQEPYSLREEDQLLSASAAAVMKMRATTFSCPFMVKPAVLVKMTDVVVVQIHPKEKN